MKIKAFGMEIQVTESAVFVNGKEVYNKPNIIDNWLNENGSPEIARLVEKSMMQGMNNYSSGSSLIKPKDESNKEQRMNVIGQNGNDGLHYQFWEEMNNDLMDNNRNEGLWDTDH